MATTETPGGASLAALFQTPGIGASLVAQEDRRKTFDRRNVVRGGGRRVTDVGTVAPATIRAVLMKFPGEHRARRMFGRCRL